MRFLDGAAYAGSRALGEQTTASSRQPHYYIPPRRTRTKGETPSPCVSRKSGSHYYGARQKLLRSGSDAAQVVLYACCRDPAMCEKALRVWDDMAEQGVPPELEPMSKLMLSCLARGRFEDGFRIFLAAIDANLQPGAQVCCALLRNCSLVRNLIRPPHFLSYALLELRRAVHQLLLRLQRACCGAPFPSFQFLGPGSLLKQQALQLPGLIL